MAKYNLKHEIAKLFDELRIIDGLKVTAATPGWRLIRDKLKETIRENEQAILSLSDNPIKNASEIEKRYWAIEIQGGIIGCVEETLTQESFISEKLKRLMEIARKAGLDIQDNS